MGKVRDSDVVAGEIIRREADAHLQEPRLRRSPMRSAAARRLHAPAARADRRATRASIRHRPRALCAAGFCPKISARQHGAGGAGYRPGRSGAGQVLKKAPQESAGWRSSSATRCARELKKAALRGRVPVVALSGQARAAIPEADEAAAIRVRRTERRGTCPHHVRLRCAIGNCRGAGTRDRLGDWVVSQARAEHGLAGAKGLVEELVAGHKAVSWK